MSIKFDYLSLIIFLSFGCSRLGTVTGQTLETSTKLATVGVEHTITDRSAETEKIIRGLDSCQLPSSQGNKKAVGQTFYLPPKFKRDKKASKHFIHGGSVLRDGKRTFTAIAGHWGLSNFQRPSDDVQWCKVEQGEHLFLMTTQTSTKQVAITLWSFNNSPFGSIIYSLRSPKTEDKELFLRILQPIIINTTN